MDVFVIGAGFAAAEEAIFLTKFARKVTVIAREPEFTCAKSIADKVLANPKIEVKFNTEILEAKGDIQLRSAKFKNNVTNEIFEYKANEGESFGIFVFIGYEPQSKLFKAKGDIQLRSAKFKNNVTNEIFEYKANEGESFGIFVFIGYEPQSKLFKNIITLDNQGFIPTDEDLATNVEGVYAAGDIRPKKLRQLVTAVSDGATAASSIEKYVHDLKGRLGVEKEENSSKTTSEVKHPTKKFLDDNIQNQLKDIFSKFDKTVKVVLIKDPEIAKSIQMEEFLSEDIFSKFDKTVKVVLIKDPEIAKSIQMEEFLSEISSLSDKIEFQSLNKNENLELEKKIDAERFPTIAFFDQDNNFKGEFQSLNKNENLELEKKIDAERFPTIAFFDQDNNFKGVKFSTLPGGHELNSFILALYNIAGTGQKISEESKKRIDSISTPHKIKIGVTLSCSRCPV